MKPSFFSTGIALLLAVAALAPVMSGASPKAYSLLAGDSLALGAPCIDNLTVAIFASTQGAFEHPITWNWGDGQTTHGISNSKGLANGDWGSHTYSESAIYYITVTVNFVDGQSASQTQIVWVDSPTSSSPSSCIVLSVTSGPHGSVSYNSTDGIGTVFQGSKILKLVPEYVTLGARAEPGYTFSHWVASGSIQGIDPCPLGPTVCTSPDLKAYVQGASSISAVFLPESTTTVICSSPVVVVGGKVDCSAQVNGTSPTGIVSWSSDSAGNFSSPRCVLATKRGCSATPVDASSVTFSPSSTISQVNLTATYGGDESNGASAGTYALAVNPPLNAWSMGPDSPTIGKGQTLQLLANPVGGIAPYQISWYVAQGPGQCLPSDTLLSKGEVLSVSPSSSTYYCYIVSDSETTPVVQASATNLVTVSPLPVPVLRVSCSRPSVIVGSTVACKASLKGSGSVPTGSLSWSSNNGGSFSQLTCPLSRGTCAVRFTPESASPVSVSVTYGGDSRYAPFSGTFALTVHVRVTRTTVSCSPRSVSLSASTSIVCLAKVVGYSPSGSVTWVQKGAGLLYFDPTFRCSCCTLSNGSCTIVLAGAKSGTVTLVASYSGDGDNKASTGKSMIVIKP